MKGYVEPVLDLAQFTCPSCHVLSLQRWSWVNLQLAGFSQVYFAQGYKCSRCDGSQAISFWHNNRLVYPSDRSVAEPNSEMPPSVKKDFLEAVAVFHSSARASCALLRLAIQRLCVELGKSGKNLNEDIGALVVDGLPERIRQSLDVVRVVGNNAVHPGELNIDDVPTVALSLFTLVNMITEYTITNPKRIQELHDSLPKGVREQISRRDSSQKDENNA